MKKLLVACCLFFLVACSSLVENELKVINDSETSIQLLFNGEDYPIVAGAEKTLKSIANGTPSYHLTFGVPLGIDSAETNEKPSLQFYDNDTKNTMLLTSRIKTVEVDGEDILVYVLDVGTTTNKNSSNLVN